MRELYRRKKLYAVRMRNAIKWNSTPVVFRSQVVLRVVKHMNTDLPHSDQTRCRFSTLTHCIPRRTTLGSPHLAYDKGSHFSK